jgi:hypothetical protein
MLKAIGAFVLISVVVCTALLPDYLRYMKIHDV